MRTRIMRVLLVAALAVGTVTATSASASASGIPPVGISAPVISTVTVSGSTVSVTWKAGPGVTPKYYSLNVQSSGYQNYVGGALWKTSGVAYGMPAGTYSVQVCASTSTQKKCSVAKTATVR